LTSEACLTILLDMKTATVREVQHNLKGVLRQIADGETVEVTRSRRVVAWITPPRARKPKRFTMPNFLERMRREYPHRPISDKQAADMMEYMRGQR